MAPALTSAVGRLRFALGDHDAESLLEGGDSQYRKLLAQCGGNELLAFRAAAGALAAYYAAQPVRISSSGKMLDYSDRVPTWRAMADGEVAYPFTPDGSAAAGTGGPQIGQITAGTAAGGKLR